MRQTRSAPAPADFADALRRRIGDGNYRRWIEPVGLRWEADALLLVVPDEATRDRLARRFADAIVATLVALGHAGGVRIVVRATPPPLPLRTVLPPAAHRFAEFVVGDSNRDAVEAARRFVDGRTPLFLHGPSGVGKTHLLHATAHALADRGVVAVCLPAAEVVTSLLAAHGAGTLDRFWQVLEPVQAILLDDVHLLAGRDEMQDRLMDDLIAWAARERLLALTSDRPPAVLLRLAARVRHPIAGGATAAIARPEPALRRAILERKAEAWGLTLDPGVAARVAGAISGNVRRLEGALRRLLAHARLYGRRVDEALAHDVLPELRAEDAPLTFDRIVRATATAFRISPQRLRGRSRRPELVLPRQVVLYLARRLLRHPYARLAAELGRDHTSALHAYRQIAARRDGDPALARRLDDIEQRLRHDVS